MLRNQDARKAIFLAINADEIIDTAYGSDELATVANSLLTPDQSLYNKDCKGYEQDLEEAKKNLEELQKQNAAKDAEIEKA